MIELLLLWFVFLATSLGTVALLAPGEAEATVRKRLRELRLPTQPADRLEQERLALPFAQRVLGPTLANLQRLAEAATPAGTRERLVAALQEAGDPVRVGEFLAYRVALAAVGLVLGLVAARGLWESNLLLALALPVVAAVAGAALPAFWLGRVAHERQRRILRALPDVLDLLSVSVEAGLGFDGAIQRVVDKFGGPIADEFGYYLRGVRLGQSREEALRAVAERAGLQELKAFTAVVIQADRLGASLARVLRVQSEDLREHRRQKAEEQALKAPIKLLFPLVLFIFPTLFVVLLGPAVLSMMATFNR